jgi:hypothetical protein
VSIASVYLWVEITAYFICDIEFLSMFEVICIAFISYGKQKS